MSRWLLEDFSEVGRLEHSDAGGSRSVRTWPCACSARYPMLLLYDRQRRTNEGNVSHTVAATSESPSRLRRAERGTDECYQGRLR
jgi:hypothetical protein